MNTRAEKARLNRQELQWPDFSPVLADRLYTKAMRDSYQEEVLARITKWNNGGQGFTPFEAREQEIAKAGGASPKFKAGAGPVARLLDREAQEHVRERLKGLQDQRRAKDLSALLFEGQRMLDPQLSTVLLAGIAAKQGEGFDPAAVLAEARAVVTRAVTTLERIFTDPVFVGVGPEYTDWRSLFEQLVRAGVFESYRPVVVTSVGGTEDAPNPSSAANALPGMALTKLLREQGYDARFIGSFASEFAIACNDLDPAKARENQAMTQELYAACANRFFPELVVAGAISFENPPLADLSRDVPKDYIDFARRVMAEPQLLGEEFVALHASLMGTAAKKVGSEEAQEKALAYLLSHQLIFRDVQAGKEIEPFVIKVGAPTEYRFSVFQRMVTEGYMNSKQEPSAVMIPNSTKQVGKGEEARWKYGQLTVYYPSLGNRPPYYKEEGSDEGSVFDLGDRKDFTQWKQTLESSIERYAALEKLLGRLGIDPSDYLSIVSAAASAHAAS